MSGDVAAVQLLTEFAKNKGAIRVLPLNVSGAFHSPSMEDPAESMGHALNQCCFSEPKLNCKIYSNVTSRVVESAVLWPDLLKQQLKSSVLWMESMQHMIQNGVDIFIECGCGEVLGGLLKRIDKSVSKLYVDDKESLGKTMEQLKRVCA